MSQFRYKLLVAITLGFQFMLALQAAPTPVHSPTSVELKRDTFAALPLRFESNAGQASPEVKFLSHGSGYSFFFTSTDAVMAFSNAHNSNPAVLTMKLLRSNSHSGVQGLEELPGRSNYFQGSNPSEWRTNIAAYGKVRYTAVYPGIDLVYYGNGMQLEYDFVVAPGADFSAVGVSFAGAERMHLDSVGDLVLLVDGEEILFLKPVAYQELGGVRRDVAVQYVLQGREVRFEVGTYDIHAPLVIDPVLSYSTFLGGSGADAANAIATDSAGNVYIAGSTTSPNFPTGNMLIANSSAQALCLSTRFSPACAYIFVTKLTADGSAVAYSSFLGGGFDAYGDTATGIAVDAAGNAYVTGAATSSSFPIVGPVMNQGKPFVLKLDPTGSTLIYSTHFGTTPPDPRFGTDDIARGISVNGSGEAYVTGSTMSPDFPLVNPLPLANCQDNVPFVTKFNAAGSALVFSTCLPSPPNSPGRAIALDVSGNVYVTGDLGPDAVHSSEDAFVTKLNSSGSLLYSTRLGGSRPDHGFGVAADSAGSAYVAGLTNSTDFPVVNAFQPALAGTADAFVTKLNSSGAIVYSTYLGGIDVPGIGDNARSIAVDSSGRAYVAGTTGSLSFPTVNALQSARRGNTDAFVAELNATGSSLLFSTYLGGSDDERPGGIALDAIGNLYVTGWTQSTDFPTMRPLQASYSGKGNDPPAIGGDAFIVKIADAAVTTFPVITSITPNTAAVGSQFTATVSGQNLASLLSVSFSGTGVDAEVQSGSLSNTGFVLTISVAADAAFGASSLTIGTPSGITTMPGALVIERGTAPATTPLPIPEVETGAIRSGYVIITPDAGSSAPLTTLTFGTVSGGLVQSQAAILPTALTNDGSLQVDVLQTIGRSLGLAIANPNDTTAVVTLTLRNEDGTAIGSPASISIPAGQQLARFVSELFPSSTLGAAFRGSLRAQSSVPVSLIGLRFSGESSARSRLFRPILSVFRCGRYSGLRLGASTRSCIHNLRCQVDGLLLWVS